MKVCVVGSVLPVTQLWRLGCTGSCVTKMVSHDSRTFAEGCFGELLLLLLHMELWKCSSSKPTDH